MARRDASKPRCFPAWPAVVALFFLVALAALVTTPLPATESEVKAQAPETEKAETEKAKAEKTETGKAAPAETEEVWVDEYSGQSSNVNTIEDIFSLPHHELAALLRSFTAED